MSDRELDCEQVIERLFDYLDGRLDTAHNTQIDDHIARCRECYSRAEFERKLRGRIAGAGAVHAPERLHRRIKKLIDNF